MGGKPLLAEKSLCVSRGWGQATYRCRPAAMRPATHVDRFILYAISVLPEYDFSPRLWWCLIDR
ncbi:hypothetical protein KCP73_23975 [Salmonella enterica subsp. enterica]|nr:hypothetical protein KCP73_23975 [Salmonella enterica subsp. enterica]